MEFDEIILKAGQKMKEGIDKYGEFDPKKDERNFKEEILAELLDAFNYATMGMSKDYGNRKKRAWFFGMSKQLIALIKENY